MKFYKLLMFVVCLSGQLMAHDHPVVCQSEPGYLIMEELLDAFPMLAGSTSSSRVNPGVLGEIINYQGIRYEVRVESFEDTMGILPVDMTFRQYLANNNLLAMQSRQICPMPGIFFDCFDFRYVGLNDGVYFSIVLRQISQ